MHTRKRHQEMFQERNQKMASADQENQSPPAEAKAAKRWSVASASSDKSSVSVKTSTFYLLHLQLSPPSAPLCLQHHPSKIRAPNWSQLSFAPQNI